MSQDQAMNEIQITRADAQAKVELSAAFDRLRKNTDFQKIIEKDYLEQEAVRLVHLKSHPSQSDEASQRAIDSAMVGIGELRQYFSAIIQEGVQMKKLMADCDAEIDFLNSEEAGEY